MEQQNKTILEEAAGILGGDRQADYGDYVENFKRIAQIATLIGRKELTAEDCVNVQIALKLARQRNKHKRDNLVDLAAYSMIKHDIVEKAKGENGKGNAPESESPFMTDRLYKILSGIDRDIMAEGLRVRPVKFSVHDAISPTTWESCGLQAVIDENLIKLGDEILKEISGFIRYNEKPEDEEKE